MPSGRRKAGSHDVAIVGAGIAGLTAARTLVDRGHDVVVLDKGRGPGGRTSSRRCEGFTFDHGAQYFTARSNLFRRQVKEWLDEGVVASWTPRLAVIESDRVRTPAKEGERHVGVPSMSAMAKRLARDLEVRSRVEVSQLSVGTEGWRVENTAGDTVARADVLIVAVPPAQAVPLLTAAPELAAQVQAVAMQPCWAVLLGFAQPVSTDFDGAFVNVGPLSWVARNASKPGRTGGEAWVLHASATWSEQHLEDDANEVIDLLKAEFASRCCASDLEVTVHAEAHRWRYAQPVEPLAASCLYDAVRRIGVAGDWCGGPRVEGAFLSGTALADRILGRTADRSAARGESDS